MPGPFRGFSPFRFLIGLFCVMASASSLQFQAADHGQPASFRLNPAGPTSAYCCLGEAANPGPDGSSVISTSNPSGLRGKEPQIASSEPGICSFSETQLSDMTFRAFETTFLRLTAERQRHVRVNGGAPQLRSNSLWAGSWSGVLQCSDFPCRPSRWAWPQTSGQAAASWLCSTS